MQRTSKSERSAFAGLLSRLNLSLYLVIGILLSGCSALNLVPEGKVLYTKSEVKLVPAGKVKARKKIKELLYSNINPEPNTSILGMRPSLWLYYKAGNPTRKGLNSFIKNKMGQAPVYMSDVKPDKTAELLEGHLKTNGFFQARVKSETVIKGKKGKVIYTAYVQRPYRIRNISTPVIDTLFANIDSLKKDSYLRKRQRYSLERLQGEQERLEEALENLGFYFFDDRHLIFEADSTVGDRKVDLTLMLEKGVPAKAKRIYKVGDVNIYPDFTLSIDTPALRTDTVVVHGYNYMDRKHFFRPSAIVKVINLEKGKIYSRTDREYTLGHLMGLGAFKFVNIKFMESPKDSATLDANIYMTPFLKKSIRAEFQTVSKSNNFVGPGLSVTLTNRNALRGSERLDLTLSSAYEVQISSKQSQALNAMELGGEAKLTFPRLLVPFNINYPGRKYLPTTEASIGSRIQQRINYFRLNSFNLAYGYAWRENTLKNHEFFPVDINFVELGKTSEDFDELLKQNPYLQRSFEDQFIPGARYSYTLNTQLNEKRETKFRDRDYEPSHIYFNARIDVAGNLIHALQGKRFEQDSTLEKGTIFGSPYSQFSKGEIDFRHYWQFAEKSQFVSRLNVGVGYAYGNSVTMPYIKQFAVGGSTSIRAFPARSLGPGTYNVRETINTESSKNTFFIDQRGDMKIEGNAEYRHDISKVIKTAVFVDAGNIWLLRDDPDRKGGKFEKKQWVNELAVGSGLGLRLDFNFFLLRFDLAFPLRKPWLPDGQRWVLSDIDPGSRAWRRENLILNIAIGYPF
jgi:outer membrane protein insertion porin family